MPSIQRATFRIGLCALTFVTLVPGCFNPYVRLPNFANPGTAAQQRADAEQFDPYPDPNMGPAIEGGRPLGFTKPLSEIEWSRRYGTPPQGMMQAAGPMVIPAPPGAFAPGPVPSAAPMATNPFSTVATPPPTFAPSATPVTMPATQAVPMVPALPAAPMPPSPTAPRAVQPRSPY